MPAQPPAADAAQPTTRLESLTIGASVTGVDPRGPVRVIQAQWHGADCLDLTSRDATGRTDSRLLYRDDEPRLEIVAPGPRWSFDGDGNLFKLAAEAQRIIKELMLRGDLKRCMVVCPGMLAEQWQDELAG